MYESCKAFWLHDGNPKRPHALLTSGKHSNGFFNSELVMESPTILDSACRDLVKLLHDQGLVTHNVNRVVGPAMGAITLAHDLARHITLETRHPCLRAYTEKDNGVMVFKKTVIQSDESIILCEDVITTGGSVDLTADAVAKAGGNVLPFIATLVNRSGLTTVGEKRIIALIECPMPMWTLNECPLCKEGSEVIRPKEKENWARLTASYN
jgi:orotate phosphoribosyltransferase